MTMNLTTNPNRPVFLMTAKSDYPDLIRSDGRRWDELRPLRITTGCQMAAEGSALIEMGNTIVLCAASVDEQLPPWRRGGWNHCLQRSEVRCVNTSGERASTLVHYPKFAYVAV